MQEADHDIIQARAIFNKLSEPSGKLARYTQASDLDSEETDMVRMVLNDYEILSIGVQAGIFDLGIIRLYMKGTVLRDWSRSAPFIMKLRTEVANDFVYYEFESLSDWLRDDRKPKRRIWTKLWF